MKVLFNGTSVSIGGGIQAAAAFLVLAFDDPRCVDWTYIVSEPLANQMADRGIDLNASNLQVVTGSPGRSREARLVVKAAERRFQPELVFTFFGPAYVRFDAPHLCGVADGWVTHSTRLAYSSLDSALSQFQMLAACLYKAWWFRQADRWIVEAPSARDGLRKRLRIDASRITIVPNTCASHYLEARSGSPRAERPGEPKRILIFAAYYGHKNLEIAPRVAKALEALDPSLEFEILLTIPPDAPPWQRIEALAREQGVAGRVRTVGSVNVSDGPALYASCDAVLHPSLLETFSATYPEAMAMEIPIVATDLPFARDVCGEAALYYSPRDAREAAARIHTVLTDPEIRERLTSTGRRVLEKLPAPADKYESLMACIASGSSAET